MDTSLKSGPIHLTFLKLIKPQGHPDLVPLYKFAIYLNDEIEVGHINFKQGDSNHITLYAGHIGYAIKQAYRGKQYSLHACLAIQPFVKKYYDSVILTAEVDNVASIKIIEKLNTRLLNVVEVPESDPAYAGGARRKVRYAWQL